MTSRFGCRPLVSLLAQVGLLALLASAVDVITAPSLLPLARALWDNAGHGALAAVGWVFARFRNPGHPSVKRQAKVEMIAVALCACFIDSDHFLTALSWRLSDATNLDGRPFAHSLLFACLCVALAYMCCPIKHFPGVLGYAFLSHHLRDATRRGLFLWPFPSTPPLPYPLYLLLQSLIPQLIFALTQRRAAKPPRPDTSHV